MTRVAFLNCLSETVLVVAIIMRIVAACAAHFAFTGDVAAALFHLKNMADGFKPGQWVADRNLVAGDKRLDVLARPKVCQRFAWSLFASLKLKVALIADIVFS